MSRAKRKVRTGIRTPMKSMLTMASLLRKLANILTGEAKRLKSADVRMRKLATKPTASSKKVAKKRSTKPVVAKPTSRTSATIAEISYALLSRKATPMTIGELATKVAKRKGRKVDTAFASNLAATLTRDERVTRVERGMYTAK